MTPRPRPSRLVARALGCAVLVAALGRVTPAEACSCGPRPPVRDALAASGTVFEGRVLSLKHEPGPHRITAKLEVLRRWKGPKSKTIDAVTIDVGSMCGFTFERGKSYLLYATESAAPISVSLCSRSTASAAAADDFAELDRVAAGVAASPSPASAAAAPASTVTPAGAIEDSGAPPPPASPPSPPPPVAAAPVAPSAPAPATRGGGCAGCSTTPAPTTSLAWSGLLALAVLAGLRRSRPAPDG